MSSESVSLCDRDVCVRGRGLLSGDVCSGVSACGCGVGIVSLCMCPNDSEEEWLLSV